MKRALAPLAIGAVLFGLVGARLQARADVPDATVTDQIDAAHSGGLPADSLTPPLAQKWAVDLGGELSSPLVAGGRVYTTILHATEGGTQGSPTQLIAIDASTGNTVWGPIALDSTANVRADLAYDA